MSSARPAVVSREFLPAALEVQQTPPSPTGRLLLWLLLALFMVGLVWAYFGRVDIVVTAPGRVVPLGQVKRVQAPETARVKAILVTEGELVSKGQPLVELDATYAEADRGRIAESLESLAEQIAWRSALEGWLSRRTSAETPDAFLDTSAIDDPTEESPALYLHHRALATAELEALAGELAVNEAQQGSNRAEQTRVRDSLQVLSERVDSYRSLMEKQYGSRVQYLELLQQQTDLERSLPVLKHQHHQLEESALALDARLQAAAARIRADNLLALETLYDEREQYEQEMRKARQRQLLLTVVAPVSGAVQELAVHSEGAVLTTAEDLMKIVPDRGTMEVEALLPNRDIGFVNEGQRAQVKLDTFNFTKYGLIDAKVLDISNDALEDPQQGWAYKLRLELETDAIMVEQKRVRLSPGMTLTAEIKTGQRRLIEFFLSPLLRARQESFGER
ncbi:MAG: HlyD family type I secretion periplasmic adaptor subunit [Pseudomonadota bacterium]